MGPMKTFLLLMLFAFNAVASSEYTCNVRLLKLKLILDSENSQIFISDAQTNQFVDNGILRDTLESFGESNLMFEMNNGNFLQVRFKTAAMKEEPETLFGLLKGSAGFQILDESVKCFKKPAI